MKFVFLISSILCLAIANLPANVTYNPQTKTYTVDKFGKNFDKKPNEKHTKDYQKILPKPTKPNLRMPVLEPPK